MPKNPGDNPIGDDKHLVWKLWVSRKIKETRDKKEIPMGMLSIIADVPEEYLHRVEKAQQAPSDIVLKKISLALEVPRSTFDMPREC
jgi:hypothetical protein